MKMAFKFLYKVNKKLRLYHKEKDESSKFSYLSKEGNVIRNN